MEKEYAIRVISEINNNTGIFYDSLMLKFPDKKPGQLYALLYVLCEPKISKEGQLESILSFKEKTETRNMGNLLGGRRAIEMGEFSLTREGYSSERLDEIFKFWQLENI
ncbi:MAG: hypothetical protein AABX11_07785 [Nanoarchaeota archaeon]